jgi:hypothetical protein
MKIIPGDGVVAVILMKALSRFRFVIQSCVVTPALSFVITTSGTSNRLTLLGGSNPFDKIGSEEVIYRSRPMD